MLQGRGRMLAALLPRRLHSAMQAPHIPSGLGAREQQEKDQGVAAM